MHSDFKERHKGEMASVTYCPLDLYSGNPARVEKAIGNLWESWIGSGGCINSLKVFVKGKIIKPNGEVSDMKERNNRYP
jgi:inositol-pentakisphosphate 2-kinase